MDAESMANAQKNQNWGCDKAKCLVEIWASEEMQRQLAATETSLFCRNS